MYSTYEGAKRRAQTLAAMLREAEVPIPLHLCQQALAGAGGYRDWMHLRQDMAKGAKRPARLEGFLRRFVHGLPDDAVGPAYRWAEAEVSSLKERARASIDRDFLDWYARVSEYVSAIGALHRSRTPLLTPGSGAGQRLRQAIIMELCVGPAKPSMDRETFVLSFAGPLESHLDQEMKHPNFEREFKRLCDGGLLAWDADAQILRLTPPPLDQVRAHITKCRAYDAEYWRQAA